MLLSTNVVVESLLGSLSVNNSISVKLYLPQTVLESLQSIEESKVVFGRTYRKNSVEIS